MKLLRLAIFGPSTSTYRQFSLRTPLLISSKDSENVIQLNDKSKAEGMKKSRKFTPGSMVLLVVPITTFILGVWQVQRYQLRRSMIADLNNKHQKCDPDFPFKELSSLEEKSMRNISYFMTWFGISAATLFMWYSQFLRKRF